MNLRRGPLDHTSPEFLRAEDILVRLMAAGTQMSRYYNAQKGTCIVVCRDHYTSALLSQAYDRMAKDVVDNNKAFTTPLILTDAQGNEKY